MARPALLALPLALLVGLQLQRSAELWSAPPADLPAAAPLASLHILLATAAVGRLLLAWLPSGPVGSHRPAHWPSTWAASHLTGLLALQLQGQLVQALGLSAAWPLWIPWMLLALARIATLPAGLVPGHAPAHQDATRITGWLTLGLALLTAAAIRSGLPASDAAAQRFLAGLAHTGIAAGAGADELARVVLPCTWAAAWIGLWHALRDARRTPLGAAGLLALVALASLSLEGASLGLAFLTAGLAHQVAWLRRADARALALACLFFAAGAASGLGWLALAGPLALALAGAEGQRTESLRAAALATAVVILPSLWWQHRAAPSPLGELRPLWLVLAGAAGLTLAVRRRELWHRAPTLHLERDHTAHFEPPLAEIRAGLAWVALASLAVGAGLLPAESEATSLLFPAGALLAGLALLPPERPH